MSTATLPASAEARQNDAPAVPAVENRRARTGRPSARWIFLIAFQSLLLLAVVLRSGAALKAIGIEHSLVSGIALSALATILIGWLLSRAAHEEDLPDEERRFYLDLALHDSLTRLPNRALLDDRVRIAVANAKRTGQRVALAFIDLDNFKMVNDSMGHAVGDRVLLDIAQALEHELRQGDTLARWGGDEFVAVLVNLAGAEEAMAVVQRLLNAAAGVATGAPTTVSIGLAIFPDDAPTIEDLMHEADRSMFRAKRHGRNRVCRSSPELTPGPGERPTWELRTATPVDLRRKQEK